MSDGMDVDDGGTQGGGFEWNAPVDDMDMEETGRADYGGRDCLLFAIDMSKNMFERADPENPDPEASALKATLVAVRQGITNRIFRTDQDLLSVVFFNTAKSKGTSFKHVFVYDDLQRPGADVVKKMDALLAMTSAEIKAEFGSTERCSIGDLIWACNSMFSGVTLKLAHKRVLLFTTNDNPHGGNKQLTDFAKQKASDIYENGIYLMLLPVKYVDGTFDGSKFWDSVVNFEDDEEKGKVDPAKTWEELGVSLRRKDHSKRALARITLSLGEGLELGVGVYSLVRPAVKPSAVKLSKTTNEQVSIETTFMEEEGATVLMPTDFKKYMTFAGKNVYFTPEDIDQMKRFGSVGLKLIAFKPVSSIKPKYYIRPAQFIYPDEYNVKGSTKLFIALLEKCLQKKVMAICQYIPRENITPKLVALVPQDEEFGELHEQITPPGFHVIFLPFAEDFRTNNPSPPEDAPKAEPNMVQKARELIRKLKFSYNPENFANPALQTHLRNVEAMALNMDADEMLEVEDFTEPNVMQMEHRAGKLMKEFFYLVYPAGYDPLKSAPKKRMNQGETDGGAKRGPASKRPAAEAPLDIPAAAEAGTLNKLTVAILKQYCTEKKIKPTGTKKDDYISAIETHLAGND